LKSLVSFLIAGALGGCLNTSPVGDSRRFFVIEPGPVPQAQDSARDVVAVVGIKPVILPAYLRDKRIVVRSSATEIEYSETIRWGEPLDQGLMRATRSILDGTLENGLVILAPWSRGDVNFEVSIRFRACEVAADGMATVDAKWFCSDVKNPGSPVYGQARLEKTGPMPSSDPEGAISILSKAIHELSFQIADTVQTCIDRAKESP
jgi:uncharacterized lipoprotein YmbA